MRTTLTLDSDVSQALKAHLSGPEAKLKRVINDLLRKALGIKKETIKTVESYPLGIKTFYDTNNLNSVVDDLLLEDFLLKNKKNNDHS